MRLMFRVDVGLERMTEKAYKTHEHEDELTSAAEALLEKIRMNPDHGMLGIMLAAERLRNALDDKGEL